MEISGYGVTLRRLTEDKIEMVRNWRNDPKIQQYMEFRDYITSEMQEKWFQRINNQFNYYFIIEVDGKEVGLINLRDIDYENRICEPGVFIWDDDYLNTDIPIRASLCNSDFGFYELGMEMFRGHVLKDNKRAIRFNSFLGYEKSSGQDDLELQEWVLKKKEYEKHTAQIKAFLVKNN